MVVNADRSKNMYMVRLKVFDGRITAIETIRANKGDAGRLWDPAVLLNLQDAQRTGWEPQCGPQRGGR